MTTDRTTDSDYESFHEQDVDGTRPFTADEMAAALVKDYKGQPNAESGEDRKNIARMLLREAPFDREVPADTISRELSRAFNRRGGVDKIEFTPEITAGIQDAVRIKLGIANASTEAPPNPGGPA